MTEEVAQPMTMTNAMIFVMMESISLMEDQQLLIAIKEMLTILTVVLQLAQLWQDGHALEAQIQLLILVMKFAETVLITVPKDVMTMILPVEMDAHQLAQ